MLPLRRKLLLQSRQYFGFGNLGVSTQPRSISAGGGIDLCKTFSVRIRGIARIEEFG
jgi:hypothetical protein